jgi:ADP-ribose pyrophosphatase YjhB (NUDIX family)
MISQIIITKTYFFSEIIQYTDLENNLDVTELVFSKTISGTPIYRSRYAQENVDRKEPYFKRIRKYIGQDYLFSCGMTVMIENEKNEIAIGRRSDEHRWAFPAGAKEINEPIIKTVHTETMEELGIKISTPQLMAVFSGEKCKTTYPNGDKMHYLTFLFKAKYKNGKLHVNDNENTEVSWIHKDQLFNVVTERLFKREQIYNSFDGNVFLDRFE